MYVEYYNVTQLSPNILQYEISLVFYSAKIQDKTHDV